LIAVPLTALAAAPPRFDYDRDLPLDVRDASPAQAKGTARVRDITWRAAAGGRTAGYLVEPQAAGARAAVLYVHWYEPESPDSNRTQFLDEAVELAGRGAVSLLVETMWSDPKWFGKRRREDDFARSVEQVKELRRALDLLLGLAGVDRGRVAYVGHDFGAMYGAVMGAVDKRPSAYVLAAGTERFSDWFLLGPPKLEGEARQKFIDSLAPLDPVAYAGKLAPAAVLFQFAHVDRFVPKEKAEALYAAAREPKSILWYDGGHGLNPKARNDRVAWLSRQLQLR
jgi:dienelactone hydrolase